MKHNAETEMDLLLRRHARREGGAARFFDDGGDAKDDASRRAGSDVHLDADELNAFAEGVLPAPARARYASHLADCDSCRKVVTELALVNSAASEEERVVIAPEPAVKSSWRAWLAALFAPSVLRFAVPAFGLLAVAFILFAATRMQRNDSMLVANNGEKQAAQSNANTSAVSQDYKSADSSTSAQSNASSRESTVQDQKVTVPGEQSGVTVPPVQKAPLPSDAKNPEQAKSETVTDEPAPVDKIIDGKRDEDRRDEEAQRNGALRERGRAREEERAAASISPPSPPASAGAVSMAKEKTEVAKDAPKNQPARPSNNAVLDGAAADNNETNGPQNKGYGGGKMPNATLSAKRRAAPPRSDTAETKTGEDDASETRKVGGRTFRRQGGAWVDTAYNSSRRIIPVRRGTEQYRALVADEPAIGSISSQLGGEVIIVWKDRAYRIDSGAATDERSERKRNE